MCQIILFSSSPPFGYTALGDAFSGAYTPNITALITTGAVGVTGFSPNFNSGMNYYVERLSGFFVPPVTANYTFYLAGDDNADLYLSSDQYAANATWAGYVTSAMPTDSYFWNLKTATGGFRAPARWLQAGNRYYFTARHLQSTLTDFLYVGVGTGRLKLHAIGAL